MPLELKQIGSGSGLLLLGVTLAFDEQFVCHLKEIRTRNSLAS